MSWTVLLRAAGKQVVIGAKYEHYKGQTYTVTGLAILEASNEVVVLYRGDYDERITFVRPLNVWLGVVQLNGRRRPRSQLIGKR